VSTEEVAQEHRLAKKLSTREISIRIGLFSFYSLFTYYFHFFPFKWLPIDFLIILSYDVFTDENFKQKSREYNYQLNQERMNETFLKQIKRTPLTINECLTYIAGIKFIFFSFQYLRNYFDCDKEVSTLIFDYEICDRTYWLTNGNAEHGSLQICVNFVFKNYKIFSEKCSDSMQLSKKIAYMKKSAFLYRPKITHRFEI
jgi:predicted RNA-binding protein